MKTKREFFADYFKGQLQVVTSELNDFAADKGDFWGEVIRDRLEGLSDEWENCVLQDAKEGYPVIDMWNEYIEGNTKI